MASEVNSQITSTVSTNNRPGAAATRSGQAVQASAESRQVLAASTNATQQRQSVQAASEQQAAAKAKKAAEDARLQQAVSDINTYVQSVNREIQFKVDEALPLGRTVITVVDLETEETIREIPSKEVQAIAHRLSEAIGENLQGLIISARA